MDFLAQYGMIPLKMLHVLGVALGLGIATGLDVLLIRLIFKHSVFVPAHYQTIRLLSALVTGALVLLWMSGAGFLVYYSYFEPHKLTNPKVWSKVLVVVILTVNGWVIHYRALPKLEHCIGRIPLIVLPYSSLALFFVTGAISALSWYVPFLYGMVPALNFAFSLLTFNIAYLALLTVAILIGLALVGYVYANRPVRYYKIKGQMLVADRQVLVPDGSSSAYYIKGKWLVCDDKGMPRVLV